MIGGPRTPQPDLYGSVALINATVERGKLNRESCRGRLGLVSFVDEERWPDQGEDVLMSNDEFLRRIAQKCRQLMEHATVPDVVTQLRLWVQEFEETAADVHTGLKTIVPDGEAR